MNSLSVHTTVFFLSVIADCQAGMLFSSLNFCSCFLAFFKICFYSSFEVTVAILFIYLLEMNVFQDECLKNEIYFLLDFTLW